MKTSSTRRKFLKSAGFLVSGIITGHTPAAYGQDRRSPLDLGIAAESLLREQRYQEALPLLREALQRDPAGDWLRGLLGRTYAGLGNQQAALDEFSQILRRDPDNDLARTWIELLSQRPLPRRPNIAAHTDPNIVAEQQSLLDRLHRSPDENRYQISRLVIDAGHGGFDPGAVGSGGTKEKDVTLSLAQTLAVTLERQYPNLRVFLTRQGDYYVPLSERTIIANRHQADLFLSIHCNAHTRRQARGLETYFCSAQASGTEARRVAAMENAALEYDPPPVEPAAGLDIENILFQLQRDRYWQESSRIANQVQQSLARRMTIPDRGVHSADFFVLRKARMPSVLLEVAFISNREEERMLQSPALTRTVTETVAATIGRL